MIPKTLRDTLTTQALKEIDVDRQYKRGVIWRFHKNEDMYYARKLGTPKVEGDQAAARPDLDSRINVELGKMQSFVHSILSKVNSPLNFKFKYRAMADVKRAKLFNALKDGDADMGFWDMKDLMGKKQAVIYGRAIYAYYADSYNGYCSHLENVDVYDFLIDPEGGGFDLDLARHLGRAGIKKDKAELRQGIKDGLYLTTETRQLINGAGNGRNATSVEEVQKQNRHQYLGTQPVDDPTSDQRFSFWEWYTTYEGERYYLLLSEDHGVAIRVEKLSDLFPVDKTLGKPMWPFWSYAAFLDLTEFWTPSYCDYVREIFMAQSVNINQMLDNGERINKPQRAVDISAVQDESSLIYRRNGIIKFKAGTDVQKAYQIISTTPIDTPIKVYELLENIHQTESGVTAGVKGVDDPNGKVGIYEGNQQEADDKFRLLGTTVSFGHHRFARLYQNGVMDNLTAKTAVDLLGPDGYEETIFISRKDIKPKMPYRILVNDSAAETNADNTDKRNKLTFLANNEQNPVQNRKKAYEIGASIAGFSADDIRSLIDPTEYGTADQISEADRDIEELINRKVIEPNDDANSAYFQRILDYFKDHKEDMDEDVAALFIDYMDRLEPVVIRNMGSQLAAKAAQAGLTPGAPPGEPVPAQTDAPPQDPAAAALPPSSPPQQYV